MSTKYEPTGWDAAYMNLHREAGNIKLPELPDPEMDLAEKLAVWCLAIVAAIGAIGLLLTLIEFIANY